jgi:uncharacterized protein YjgD (DUF1641 family)
MARPTDAYPESATNAAREAQTNGEGKARLERAVDEHGEDIAAALDRVGEFDGLLTTAVLVLASADDDEVEHVTNSTANLVEAVDGLTTDGTADLAGELGQNADDLSATLDAVLDLQRAGHLDDLLAVATAFTESLSPEELEELAATVEENGADVVDALDVVLELQREGHLEGLVDLARAFSALEVDPEAVEGLNALLAAVGDAQEESEPVSLLGSLRRLRNRDARAGLGYLIALLRGLGRRLRER